MLSLSNNFLFIHVAKTGGNAMQQSLARFSDDFIVCIEPHHDGVERFEVRSEQISINKYSTLSEYLSQLPENCSESLYKFSCVRNPWARCVSHFHSPHRGQVDFSESLFGDFIASAVKPVEHY